MLGVFFLIVLFFILNQGIFGFYAKRHTFLDKKKLNFLYFYHLLFYGVYLWYAYNNPSDSKGYYNNINIHNGSWFELFGTDTHFIDFLAYPLNLIGFTYEMLMLTFAWLGYLGFFYAYLFFREKRFLKFLKYC